MKITIAPMVDPNVWEPPYLTKILSNMIELDDSYHFIISRTNTYDEIQQFKSCIIPGLKNILILLSDEQGIIPYFMEDLFLVFRTYNRRDLYDNVKIFPIPCGYYSKNDDVENSEVKLLKDRKYDMFYSGQQAPNRISAIQNVNKIKDNFNSLINVTDGFAKGYTSDEYYNFLRDSKIAIVPNGAVVPESFRYFEAFRTNCVVITSYPTYSDQFNHWFYENSPAIFIRDWNELTIEMVENILKEENLNKYDSLNKEYFDRCISPKGVSNYMMNVIKNKM